MVPRTLFSDQGVAEFISMYAKENGVHIEQSPTTKIERLKESRYVQDFDGGDFGRVNLEFNVVLDKISGREIKYNLGVEFSDSYAAWNECKATSESEAIFEYIKFCERISRKDYRPAIDKDGRLSFEVSI